MSVSRFAMRILHIGTVCSARLALGILQKECCDFALLICTMRELQKACNYFAFLQYVLCGYCKHIISTMCCAIFAMRIFETVYDWKYVSMVLQLFYIHH